MQWVAAIFRNDGGPMLRSFRSTSYAQSAVVIRSTHIAIDVGRVNSMNVPSSSSYEVPDFQQCIRIWSMFRSWTKAMTRNSSSARASNKTASPWFGILIVSFFFFVVSWSFRIFFETKVKNENKQIYLFLSFVGTITLFDTFLLNIFRWFTQSKQLLGRNRV